MKSIRAIGLGVGVILATAGGFSQERIRITFPKIDWATGWAAGAKVSTLGPGIECIKSVNSNWNARLGFAMLPFSADRNLTVGSLDVNMLAKTRLGGINLQGDFFFIPWFYFTGGLLINLVQSDVQIQLTNNLNYGDISIDPSDIGTFSAKVKPGWPVTPFLGIGFGNPMPVNRRIWFNVDLGAAYHGKPRFDLSGNGMISPTASEANEKALETAFKGYRFYPLLSAQVIYRIR